MRPRDQLFEDSGGLYARECAADWIQSNGALLHSRESWLTWDKGSTEDCEIGLSFEGNSCDEIWAWLEDTLEAGNNDRK